MNHRTKIVECPRKCLITFEGNADYSESDHPIPSDRAIIEMHFQDLVIDSGISKIGFFSLMEEAPI